MAAGVASVGDPEGSMGKSIDFDLVARWCGVHVERTSSPKKRGPRVLDSHSSLPFAGGH
jgi:hypothetical protein